MKYFLILSLLVFSSLANAKIRVDEENDNQSSFRAETGRELRKTRRVGVGFSAAGALGIGGIDLELNFTHDSGVVIGFGGAAPGIQIFEVEYKGVLAGESLLPYFTFGFAHWGNYGPNNPITDTNPSYLSEKLLSASQRSNGQVQENLIYPGFGLQFVQLSGPLAGHSLYIEADLLLDVGEFVAVPTASVGYLYYF